MRSGSDFSKSVVGDFMMSRYPGENEVYLSFEETDAGSSGALLIRVDTLKRLMREVGILDD